MHACRPMQPLRRHALTPGDAGQDEEGGRTLFIDCSVYSRNRAFRLFLSSKAGKTAVLQPTGAAACSCNTFISREAYMHGPNCSMPGRGVGPAGRYQGPKLSHKGLFFQSLICNVAEGARLLQCFDDADGARFSWVSRCARKHLFCCVKDHHLQNPASVTSHQGDNVCGMQGGRFWRCSGGRVS